MTEDAAAKGSRDPDGAPDRGRRPNRRRLAFGSWFVLLPVAVVGATALGGAVAGPTGARVVGVIAILAAVALIAWWLPTGRRRTAVVGVLGLCVALVVATELLRLPASSLPPGSAPAVSTTPPATKKGFAGQSLDQAVVDTVQDFRGADLRGAHLDGRDIRGVDLSGARADGATFDHSRLDRAVLRGASLAGAVLRSACLRNADLTGADLTGADATGADVGGAVVSPGATSTVVNWGTGPPSTACAAAP